MTGYIYAICRSYEKSKDRIFNDESIITVGIEQSPLAVQDFNIFKRDNGDYIVRMEKFGKANGVVFGAIEGSHQKVKMLRIIPLDDLVEASKITRPVK